MFPDAEIKAKAYRSLPEKPDNTSALPANKLSNKIQVLHSVFDQSTEINEWANMNINITEKLKSYPSNNISSDKTRKLVLIYWLLCF